MFKLYFNNNPLLDLRDEKLIIRDPYVHLGVGEAGEMKFTIDHDHPKVGLLKRLHGTLDLRSNGKSIFKGRIAKDTQDFFLSRVIEAEGLMACLNDSVIPPFAFPDDFLEDADYLRAAESGNVIEFFLGWLINQHNGQVSTAQKIYLGEVTVKDPNNYITRSSDKYLTTMEVVRQKLKENLNGYLLIDYSGDIPVLNYYADLPLTNTQTVEFGENLLDLTSELDCTATYTAILPVGKDGLTIEGLPDGEISEGVVKDGRIIYSKSLEESMEGTRIIRMVEWEDVTIAENLRTKAAAALTTEGILTAQTITVKAVDLGGTYTTEYASGTAAIAGTALAGQAIAGTSTASASGYSRFAVGQYVELKSTPHDFSVKLPLMELEPDILNPGQTEIILGKHRDR